MILPKEIILYKPREFMLIFLEIIVLVKLSISFYTIFQSLVVKSIKLFLVS